MKRKIETKLRGILDEIDCELVQVSQGGSSHPRVRIRHRASGLELSNPVPGSPSDHRGWKNWKCQVRRRIRDLLASQAAEPTEGKN